MRFVRLSGTVALLGPIIALGCGGSPSPSKTAAPPPAAIPSAEPDRAAAPASGETVSGTVAETMSSGGYTYARLSGPEGDKWMAAPEILSIEIGDVLTGDVSMPMRQFRSRTLNREFDVIYFVSRVSRNGEALAPMPESERGIAMAGSHAAEPAAAAIAPVAPAPGGLRVAEVWSRRDALTGTTVLVRGRVVKANYEIMGVNWYHLRDGSGMEEDGTNDLTVTSDGQAKVGDVITISGTLSTGKDFGAGYAYQAIVEKASIRK
jgi:hypothetical protein